MVDLITNQEKCEAQLASIRKRYTDPDDMLYQKYVLRGVGTMADSRTSKTYFIHRHHWWEASFDAGSSAGVKKIDDVKEVLQAAGMLDRDVMLVYVKADVLAQEEEVELPDSLKVRRLLLWDWGRSTNTSQTFVERDNAHFAAELDRDTHSGYVNPRDLENSSWQQTEYLSPTPFDPKRDTTTSSGSSQVPSFLNTAGLGRGRGGGGGFYSQPLQQQVSRERMDIDGQPGRQVSINDEGYRDGKGDGKRDVEMEELGDERDFA